FTDHALGSTATSSDLSLSSEARLAFVSKSLVDLAGGPLEVLRPSTRGWLGGTLGPMREPGRILLIACYQLGHQPLSVAWPAAFLGLAAYAPAFLALSAGPPDPEKIARARLVAISVPMHTALRLGVIAARCTRALNPDAHICLHGHYAALNATELLS